MNVAADFPQDKHHEPICEATVSMTVNLLRLAMRSPAVVDHLVTIVLTDGPQMIDPKAGIANAVACRSAEALLNGEACSPAALDARAAMDLALGSRDSDVFLDLHYNAGRYLRFLMHPEEYPQDLRAEADARFAPLGHDLEWRMPDGFQAERGLLRWIHRSATPQIETRLRRGRMSPTVILIERPAETEFLYPWQQAASCYSALRRTPTPATDISTRYVTVGNTRTLEVSYRHEALEVVKVPILIRAGLERMISLQSLSLHDDRPLFHGFLESIH